jgi:hypothetical protein
MSNSTMKRILPILIVIVVAGGIGFYVGTKVSSGTAPTLGQFRGGPGTVGTASSTRTGRQGGMNGGFTGGEVVSVSDTSLTVELSDGGSKIILLSPTTRVFAITESSLLSVATGTEVSVTGTTNSDGSVTADTIQVRPAGGTPAAPPASQ